MPSDFLTGSKVAASIAATKFIGNPAGILSPYYLTCNWRARQAIEFGLSREVHETSEFSGKPLDRIAERRGLMILDDIWKTMPWPRVGSTVYWT
jgi:hypothetical protein